MKAAPIKGKARFISRAGARAPTKKRGQAWKFKISRRNFKAKMSRKKRITPRGGKDFRGNKKSKIEPLQIEKETARANARRAVTTERNPWKRSEQGRRAGEGRKNLGEKKEIYREVFRGRRLVSRMIPAARKMDSLNAAGRPFQHSGKEY